MIGLGIAEPLQELLEFSPSELYLPESSHGLGSELQPIQHIPGIPLQNVGFEALRYDLKRALPIATGDWRADRTDQAAP